jgi:hypothetical protein
MATHEQNQKSLARLRQWKENHPGADTDGGFISLDSDEDAPEDFREVEETIEEAEARVQTFFRADKVSKIFRALAVAPQNTLNRNDIRARVLDSQMSAAELDDLRDSEPLIAKFIELDYSRVNPQNKKPIERWILKPEYKNHIELACIFGYTPPAQEKKPERAVSTVLYQPPPTPGPNGEYTTQQLVLMPWREFSRLPRDTQRLLPHRSGTMNDSAASQALWEEERKHWPLVEDEREDSRGKLRKEWHREMPENYHFESAELSRLEWAEKNVLHTYLNGNASDGTAIPIFLTPSGDFFDLHQRKPRTDLRMVRGEPMTGDLNEAHRRKIYKVGSQPSPSHRLVPATSGTEEIIWSDAPPKYMSPAELAAVKPPPIKPIRVENNFVSTAEIVHGVSQSRREEIYKMMEQSETDRADFEARRSDLLPVKVWDEKTIAQAHGEQFLKQYYARQAQ